jgi:hypothetical protein
MLQIAVFSAFARCEREDVHLCQAADHDATYCLQITLKLPRNALSSGELPWVTGLLCPTIGPECPSLWAGDSTGQLTIWYIPKTGLDFTPAYTAHVHNKSINDIKCTWRHAITISDDGCVILHDIIGFHKVRTVDIMYYAAYYNLFNYPVPVNHDHSKIQRRIASVCVRENFEVGGQLALGTSYGEIVMLSLGTTI